MHTLITRFKTKQAIAETLAISPAAVAMAFSRGTIPATWLPKLKAQGLTHDELAALPLTRTGAAILAAFRDQQ